MYRESVAELWVRERGLMVLWEGEMRAVGERVGRMEIVDVFFAERGALWR